jgi:hypothetical protein
MYLQGDGAYLGFTGGTKATKAKGASKARFSDRQPGVF